MSRLGRRKTGGDETNVLSVHVPITFRRRGGRKTIVTPNGATPNREQNRSQPNSALARAIARAWRWQKMLESGTYSTIAELAVAEKVSPPFVSKILRLNLLAPEIVQDVLNGRAKSINLADLHMQACLDEWSRQRRLTKEPN